MTGPARLSVVAAVATALAALCLGAVLRTASWVLPSIVAIAGAAAGGAAARRLGVPRLLVPLAGLAGLLVALTASFARDAAWVWVLPTPGVFEVLADLAAAGRETIVSHAAPVVPDTGLVAVTAAGVGAVAVAVDTLAVTWRSPALAGGPLVALFCVPAALAPDGVGWGAFALGAAGFLGLLLTDARDRVSRWGRPLAGSGRSPRERTGPLAAVGRRVGVAAVGLAVLLPVAAPGLDDGLLRGGGGVGRGSGANTVAVINPIIDLGRDLNRPDDREVLRYQTRDEDPAYLRLVVLDRFTGEVWEPTRLRVPRSQTVDRGLAAPVGLDPATAREQVRTEVTVFDLASRWLPLPFPAQRVDDIDGSWLWDEATFNVFSVQSSTRGQDYTVFALDVQPSRSRLRDAPPLPEGLGRFLELPEDLPASIRAVAERVTAGSDTSYDEAVALQEWLRDPSVFTYDERAPDGTGFTAIANFLRDRHGFCVHFASTMAVLARSLGIPARVAVGFLPGEEVGPGTWSVRTRDAHAWPELYFEGAGWLAFEPTPAVRTGTAPAYARPLPREGPAASPTGGAATPTSGPSATATGRPGVVRPEDRASGGAAGAGGGARDLPWGWLATGVAALLLALAPAAARQAVRRRRWSHAENPQRLATAAWDEVGDLTVDYGVESPVPATPRQFAAHLAAAGRFDEPQRSALGRVAGAAERATYARTVGDVGNLRADVATVRSALAGRASRRRRLRAAVLPASTARLVHLAGERVADVLDALDRAGAALRERLVPRRRGGGPRGKRGRRAGGARR